MDEIVIAGGGLAGIVAAYELLGRGRRVLLIDKDRRENFGEGFAGETDFFAAASIVHLRQQLGECGLHWSGYWFAGAHAEDEESAKRPPLILLVP